MKMIIILLVIIIIFWVVDFNFIKLKEDKAAGRLKDY